jgi:capsid portal protein
MSLDEYQDEEHEDYNDVVENMKDVKDGFSNLFNLSEEQVLAQRGGHKNLSRIRISFDALASAAKDLNYINFSASLEMVKDALGSIVSKMGKFPK